MPLPRSTKSFARFARATLAAGLVLGAGLALRDDRADACGYEAASIEEVTTFDPKVLGDPTWDGLYYDPFNAGYGGPCTDCATKAMVADWRGYLKEAVTEADWQKVLFSASPGELAAIANHLAGKGSGSPPPGYERSSLWKSPADRERLAAAVAVVSLARKVEPHATFEAYDARGNPKPAKPPAASLLADAQAGLKAAQDPFLAQRYAFQAVRILFYRRDWTGAVTFFDKNAAALAGPSADLPWRARYYLAGALARDKKLARANLELARVHANYPPLSGAAAQDFKPMEEADWRATLRLARDVREKTQLWRLVGVKQDGIVAFREIVKLDPKSDLLGLLAVRELARIESMVTSSPAPPAELAAQRKAYGVLEQLAAAQAATAGADRPWLMELVAGHIAARRGDVANAKTRLARAVKERSGDKQVAAQAKASFALALAMDWKLNPATEQELAKTMSEIDPKFSRLSPVRSEVRSTLAAAYVKAGKLVDAEFLRPGAVTDAVYASRTKMTKPPWTDPAFLKEMIARTGRGTSAFDRFVLAGSYQRPALEQELALRYLLDGDFAAASQTFRNTKAASRKLGTDPFVIHIVDCHDCDHKQYATAPWTHASFAARLDELARAAKGNNQAAAEASLALGNALYNVTWYGNARVVLDSSHQATRDTRAAEKWYRRAFDLSKDRELKAKAAYLAAKAELGGLITADEEAGGSADPLPVPKTWFSQLKTLSDTQYYREVLKECVHFADWAKRKP